MFLYYSCVMNNKLGFCPLYEYVSEVIIQNANEAAIQLQQKECSSSNKILNDPFKTETLWSLEL